MSRIWVPILAVLATAVLVAPVFADSPHFIGSPTITKNFTSGVTVSWKAAGLANAPTAAFLTASSVFEQWECVNHGGNVAPGQPIVVQNVAGPTVNIAPHNGQITFTVSIPPLPTPSPKTVCPNGNWSVQITALTFFGVVVHIQQNGVDILTADLGTIDP